MCYSYGRVEELVYFASLKEQYEIVVHHYIQVLSQSFEFLVECCCHLLLLLLIDQLLYPFFFKRKIVIVTFRLTLS